MQIQNLPSANIYRFKSVLGLILFVISLSLMAFITTNYHQKNYLINQKSESTRIQIQYLFELRDGILVSAKNICKLNKCICEDEKGELCEPIFEKGAPIIYHNKKELKELIEKYNSISIQLDIKNSVIESNNKTMDTLWEFSATFFVITFLLLISALFILITGFREWKNKIQKFQDVILKEEARRINLG